MQGEAVTPKPLPAGLVTGKTACLPGDYLAQPTPKAHSRLTLELPWPPTVNMYWRHVGNKVLLSKAGRLYKQRVASAVLQQSGRGGFGDARLWVRIDACPPDGRKRDLDNVIKGILDSLAAAGLYNDDSQVDELRIRRMPCDGRGRVYVTIGD